MENVNTHMSMVFGCAIQIAENLFCRLQIVPNKDTKYVNRRLVLRAHKYFYIYKNNNNFQRK